VVHAANDSHYGLVAYVWSKDISSALQWWMLRVQGLGVRGLPGGGSFHSATVPAVPGRWVTRGFTVQILRASGAGRR
jgi:acyl-CoA reductase-like NAD-dependent aldehyde dehydrogenase